MSVENPKFLRANVIECPVREFEPRTHNLFLAGGISNCPDWQSQMIERLQSVPDLNIFNPRRKEFSIEDTNMAREQILWEYEMLARADMLSFWFSSGSLNPITLYELGMWVNSRPDSKAVIGVDPEYLRRNDVIIQTQLARPDITVVSSLDELAAQIVSKL